MSYLDIDTILAEEERLPCVFKTAVKDLGYLDPNNTHSSLLPANSRVELPLWLAHILSNQNIVEMELPKHFRKKMREELALPSIVNLREYSYYFFEIGLQLGRATRDDDLIKTLRLAFTSDRFRDLLNHSLSSCLDDSADFSQQLTSREQYIFREGVQISCEVANWRQRNANLIRKSSIFSDR